MFYSVILLYCLTYSDHPNTVMLFRARHSSNPNNTTIATDSACSIGYSVALSSSSSSSLSTTTFLRPNLQRRRRRRRRLILFSLLCFMLTITSLLLVNWIVYVDMLFDVDQEYQEPHLSRYKRDDMNQRSQSTKPSPMDTSETSVGDPTSKPNKDSGGGGGDGQGSSRRSSGGSSVYRSFIIANNVYFTMSDDCSTTQYSVYNLGTKKDARAVTKYSLFKDNFEFVCSVSEAKRCKVIQKGCYKEEPPGDSGATKSPGNKRQLDESSSSANPVRTDSNGQYTEVGGQVKAFLTDVAIVVKGKYPRLANWVKFNAKISRFKILKPRFSKPIMDRMLINGESVVIHLDSTVITAYSTSRRLFFDAECQDMELKLLQPDLELHGFTRDNSGMAQSSDIRMSGNAGILRCTNGKGCSKKLLEPNTEEEDNPQKGSKKGKRKRRSDDDQFNEFLNSAYFGPRSVPFAFNDSIVHKVPPQPPPPRLVPKPIKLTSGTFRDLNEELQSTQNSTKNVNQELLLDFLNLNFVHNNNNKSSSNNNRFRLKRDNTVPNQSYLGDDYSNIDAKLKSMNETIIMDDEMSSDHEKSGPIKIELRRKFKFPGVVDGFDYPGVLVGSASTGRPTKAKPTVNSAKTRKPSNQGPNRPPKRKTKRPHNQGPNRPPKRKTKRPHNQGPNRPPKRKTKRPHNQGPNRPPKRKTKRPHNQGPNRPPKRKTKRPHNQGPNRPPKRKTKRPSNHGPNRPPKRKTKRPHNQGPNRPPKRKTKRPHNQGPNRPPKRKTKRPPKGKSKSPPNCSANNGGANAIINGQANGNAETPVPPPNTPTKSDYTTGKNQETPIPPPKTPTQSDYITGKNQETPQPPPKTPTKSGHTNGKNQETPQPPPNTDTKIPFSTVLHETPKPPRKKPTQVPLPGRGHTDRSNNLICLSLWINSLPVIQLPTGKTKRSLVDESIRTQNKPETENDPRNIDDYADIDEKLQQQQRKETYVDLSDYKNENLGPKIELRRKFKFPGVVDGFDYPGVLVGSASTGRSTASSSKTQKTRSPSNKGTNQPSKGKSKRPPKGKSKRPPKGKSKRPPKGKSKRPPKGKSKRPPKGKSKRPPKGKSKRPPKGKSKRPPKGKSKRPPKGKSKLPPKGKSKRPPKGKSKSPHKPVPPNGQQPGQQNNYPETPPAPPNTPTELSTPSSTLRETPVAPPNHDTEENGASGQSPSGLEETTEVSSSESSSESESETIDYHLIDLECDEDTTPLESSSTSTESSSSSTEFHSTEPPGAPITAPKPSNRSDTSCDKEILECDMMVYGRLAIGKYHSMVVRYRCERKCATCDSICTPIKFFEQNQEHKSERITIHHSFSHYLRIYDLSISFYSSQMSNDIKCNKQRSLSDDDIVGMYRPNTLPTYDGSYGDNRYNRVFDRSSIVERSMLNERFQANSSNLEDYLFYYLLNYYSNGLEKPKGDLYRFDNNQNKKKSGHLVRGRAASSNKKDESISFRKQEWLDRKKRTLRSAMYYNDSLYVLTDNSRLIKVKDSVINSMYIPPTEKLDKDSEQVPFDKLVPNYANAQRSLAIDPRSEEQVRQISNRKLRNWILLALFVFAWLVFFIGTACFCYFDCI